MVNVTYRRIEIMVQKWRLEQDVFILERK
uniref:Uncharacterized protein n=1 Tax=Anguilla anguilla TaxID=7936 RepID=A0A0E9XQJ9_ANGAN